MKSTAFDKTLPARKAQWIYDLIGKRYDFSLSLTNTPNSVV